MDSAYEWLLMEMYESCIHEHSGNAAEHHNDACTSAVAVICLQAIPLRSGANEQ